MTGKMAAGREFNSTLKRKRVGAGFRGSSSLFQTAADLLKETLATNTDPNCEEEKQETGGKPKIKSSTSSPVKAKNSTTSSMSSPNKKLTKKQQKLAEAAKDTRCISQYFGKKQVDTIQIKGGNVSSSELREESLGSPDPPSSDFITVKSNSTDVLGSDGLLENPAMNASPPLEPMPKQDEMDPEVSADPGIEGENNKSETEKMQPKWINEDKSQSPPVKRSRLLKEKIRRVTFDPVVQENQFNTMNGDAAEIQKNAVTLKEAADVVVKCLDPFYKKGKFANKDLFKSFARFLSHLLTEKKTVNRVQVKLEAIKFIKSFFSRIERCESEMDWKHLKIKDR